MYFPLVCCQDASAVDAEDSEVASGSSSKSYGGSSTSSVPVEGDQPSGCEQAWPYCFFCGERAWAKGGNHKWRRVFLLDDGCMQEHDGRSVPFYSATWTNDGFIVRGTFSPLLGDIKPDTKTIRKLLRDEKVPIQGEEDRHYLDTIDPPSSTGQLSKQ
ncbi:hypothetical protein F5I97DRAFT_1826477 [Phlebopus sp. FC_14]|nr:hypothetical protein F5I97DRAFT_1826477 [Phlebopus sp. FC_14]